MFDFSAKVLVLSGAAGGIGREIATLFAQCGARLVLGDRDEKAVLALARSIDPDDETVAAMRYDAASSADARALVALAQIRFGRIDFLVPGAGIYPEERIDSMTDEQWRQLMSINLDGVFYLVHHALPLMAEGGSIVNIASVAGHRGSHSHAHYSASKGALLALTKSLALEEGPRLRVNAVSPGIIETSMTEGLRRARGEQLLMQTPLGRNGHPREVASVIAFLCSDAASFVTGETIHVNGGLYMAG